MWSFCEIFLLPRLFKVNQLVYIGQWGQQHSTIFNNFLLNVSDHNFIQDLYMLNKSRCYSNCNTAITALLFKDSVRLNKFFIQIFFVHLANSICMTWYINWPVHFTCFFVFIFWSWRKNSLIRKKSLVSQFMASQPG